jgi:hypothetical protein
MTPSEIITKDTERRGSDADVMLRKVNKLIQGKAAILLQENDTVLMLITIAKGVAELHLFTADAPLSLTKAMKVFWKKIKDSELKRVYTDITNPQVLEMAKRTGWNIQKSNMPRYNAMAVVKS